MAGDEGVKCSSPRRISFSTWIWFDSFRKDSRNVTEISKVWQCDSSQTVSDFSTCTGASCSRYIAIHLRERCAALLISADPTVRVSNTLLSVRDVCDRKKHERTEQLVATYFTWRANEKATRLRKAVTDRCWEKRNKQEEPTWLELCWFLVGVGAAMTLVSSITQRKWARCLFNEPLVG